MKATTRARAGAEEPRAARGGEFTSPERAGGLGGATQHPPEKRRCVVALTLLALPVIIYKQPLLGHQKTKALYAVQTVQPIFKIALMAAAVPLYGVSGAVGAAVIAEFANVSLSAAAFGWVTRPRTLAVPPAPIDPTEPPIE